MIGIVLISSCNSDPVIQPEEKEIVDAVFATGHIISENEYMVTANTEGYLIHSFAKEGDIVKPGMPLYQLSNDVQAEQLSNAEINYQDALQQLKPSAPEMLKFQIQIDQHKAQLELDQANYDRFLKLKSSGAVSVQEFEKAKLQLENSHRNIAIAEQSKKDYEDKMKLNLKNAETQLIVQKEGNDDYYLTSSIDGLVLQVFKNQGELVRRGEAIAKIGGGEALVKLFIAEEDINMVKLEQTVYLNLNTEKDKFFRAAISKIYPSFDVTEQSFIAEAKLLEEARLFDNTQLQANIIINEKSDALVIPTSYLLNGDKVMKSNKEIVEVKTGIKNSSWTEILEGIDVDAVLVKPSQL